MNTVGVIGAMDEEIAIIKSHMSEINSKTITGLDFYIGDYLGKKVVLVKSGIGKVNAAICAQVMIDNFDVDCLINVGCAGALHKDLKIGDIVVSDDAVQYDMDCTAFGDKMGIIPRMKESFFKADERLVKLAKDVAEEICSEHKVLIGRVASGDKFVGDSASKAKILSDVQGFCCEMEGAAIAHACYLNKVPFVIIRSISDNADGEADMTFEKFVPIAAKNSSNFIEEMLKKM